MIKNRPLLLLFRVVLGGLFIYAGVVKVADPLGFAQDIRNYRLVGQAGLELSTHYNPTPYLDTVVGTVRDGRNTPEPYSVRHGSLLSLDSLTVSLEC